MGITANLRLLSATLLSFGLIHLGAAHLPIASEWQVVSDRAIATTGGRARGGSFEDPAPAEPFPAEPFPSQGAPYGGGGYSQPPLQTDPYGYPGGDPYGYGRSPSYYPRDPYYREPSVVVIPNRAPDYAPGYSTTIDFPPLLLLAPVGLFLLAPFFLMGARSRSVGNRSSYPSTAGVRLDDRVTVTRLQVALLAGARPLQSVLEQIATRNNLQSKQGLSLMLQETVLALLRSPQYWSHVRVDSQTVNSRQDASQLFEQLSIEERSNVSSETLVNVNGQVQRQTMQTSTDDQLDSGYIVVTLLLGTGHDRPLLNTIHSPAELQAALQQLGAIPPQELLVFELLWTPQDPSDVLSRDELISEYPTMVQIS